MSESGDFEGSIKLAFSHLLAKRNEEAIEICERLERSNPERSEQLFVLAMGAVFLGDLPGAISFMEEGHKRAPHILEYTEALAVLHTRVGNLGDSVYYAKLGLVADSSPLLCDFLPKEFRDLGENFSHVGLSNFVVEGWIAFHEKRYADAVDLADKEIRLSGGDADCYCLYGRALGETHEFERGIAALDQSIQMDPEKSEVQIFLGDMLKAAGRVSEALDAYENAIQKSPQSTEAHSQLISALAFGSKDNWDSAAPWIVNFDRVLNDIGSNRGKPAKLALPEPLPRIRVAYLIDEVGISNNRAFLETVVAGRTEERFRVSVYQQYSQAFQTDAAMRRSADDWRATYDIDDTTFAHIVKNDDIHILVDMCGLSHGSRPSLLARRVAPLQVSWLGFPFIGCPSVVDAVIEDETVSGEDGNSVDGVARCLMAGNMVCYAGGSVAIEVEAKGGHPFEKNGHSTFGAMLDLPRVAQSVELWGRVLSSVPESKLILGGTGELSQSTTNYIAGLFEPFGVTDQIKLQESSNFEASRGEFLSAIDIFLDSHPVNCGDLICDALWMGVPVVAMLGDRPVGRFGATILQAAGQEDWIASDLDAYVDIATGLARDPKKISTYRETLREQTMASSLCDTEDFMARLEATFEDLCRQHACR